MIEAENQTPAKFGVHDFVVLEKKPRLAVSRAQRGAIPRLGPTPARIEVDWLRTQPAPRPSSCGSNFDLNTLNRGVSFCKRENWGAAEIEFGHLCSVWNYLLATAATFSEGGSLAIVQRKPGRR